MSVYRTRKIRSAAAVILLLSGISHISQLWFRATDETALATALLGTIYLLMALGLAGQSRFALWVAAFTTMAAGGMRVSQMSDNPADPLLAWHLLADVCIAILCAAVLYRTRFAEMD